jgi:hypothetical protein
MFHNSRCCNFAPVVEVENVEFTEQSIDLLVVQLRNIAQLGDDLFDAILHFEEASGVARFLR